MATTTTTTNTTQLEAIEKLPSVSANPDDHATIDSVHTAIEPVTDPEVTIHAEKSWVINDAYDNLPESGYAWLVVFGAFCSYFTTLGIETSCFAGSLLQIAIYVVSPIAQFLTSQYGVRPVLIAGTILSVLGLELAGFTTEIYHLYLTQGLLFGAGASLLFVAAISVPPQWLNRRRGLGMGIVTSGSAIGGIALPFIMTSLTSKVGGAWTYRALGFIVLGFNLIACILMKEKYPHKNKVKSADDGEQQPPATKRRFTDTFDWTVIKNVNFCMWMLASMISVAGYFIPYFYLPTYTTGQGFSSHDATVIMAILSTSSFVGRVFIGYMSDRIGRLNTHLLCLFVSAISCLLLWMFAHTYGTIMAFAVMFGFVGSSYYTVLSPLTASILGVEKFPTGLTLMLLSNIISIFGVNVAAAIQDSLIDAQPYIAHKIFAGVSFGLGFVICMMLKLKATRSLVSKI
ncbi:mfs transporter [Lichtheimia corymbifera JMRC:FSU:9682]|uniref:Mfs transporter n=1 Tax=Lichtheimia corymbifera JMRC:FSU:9682 TaxID=1263082 RepID=A0A068S9U0_9FUNG|nr:mfs transporter [Lichtheimia corymbifera JMRC:FSU:9682]